MGTIRSHTLSGDLAEPLAQWRTGAACKGVPMDPAEGSTDEQVALWLCRERCPVLTECSSWVMALDAGLDPGGVCGGTTERDRPYLRANTSRTAGRITAAEIRAWCASTGVPVVDRGPIPAHVRERYNAAHTNQ